MLIKSERSTTASEPDEENNSSFVNGQTDKLQERLKQDQVEEEKSAKLRHHSTLKHSDNRDRRLNKTWSPSDITEIKPYLLLCGAIALRGNVLEDLKVTCVINATRELPDTPLPTSLQNDILYLRVNVDDKSDSDILSWLDMVTDIIHQVKMAGGKTLIHCVAGISRSATLCLAYLIKYEGYSLHDSYTMLKTLRHVIRPNSGFFGQLIEFEKRITGKQTVVMIHSDYTHSCIPQLYEEDYHRSHMLRCGRVKH